MILCFLSTKQFFVPNEIKYLLKDLIDLSIIKE